ncbi:MAG: hypothetical protein JWN98_73 [Abditibacteriota bacterium]|nr:hypothetical protein [Abditibacteriota bacterium]
MALHAKDIHDTQVDNSIAAGDKHPPEYQRDLNPEAMAGQNIGQEGPHPEKEAGHTAHEIKEFQARYPQYNNDELKRIVILPPGSRLEQGASYVDLRQDQIEVIKATSDMVAGEDNWLVPKAEVDYELWNRLTGVVDPQRTNEA